MTADFDRRAFNERQRVLVAGVKRLFASFVDAFAEVRGVPEDERVAWADLVDELVTLRETAGHTDPTAFLAEILVTEGMATVDPPFEELDPDEEESERWTKDITDAVAARRPVRRTRKQPGVSAASRPRASRTR